MGEGHGELEEGQREVVWNRKMGRGGRGTWGRGGRGTGEGWKVMGREWGREKGGHRDMGEGQRGDTGT